MALFSKKEAELSNPKFSSLILLQLRVNRRFHKSKGYEIPRRPARLLIDSISEGIEKGEFKKSTDPYLVRSILLGSVEHLLTRWHLLGKPENPSQYLDPIIDVVLNGIRQEQPAKDLVLHLHIPDELLPSRKNDTEE